MPRTRTVDADGTSATVRLPTDEGEFDSAGDTRARRPYVHSPAPRRSQSLGLAIQMLLAPPESSAPTQ